eukprot:g11422.t1
MSTPRMPREKPFLDDPDAYPEYSVLIQRHPVQHAFRLAIHRHRTAALFALAACSAKLSGAPPPSFDGDWYTAAGLHAVAREWGAFLAKGLALDLLARHFQGIESALACMLAMIAAAALVYPLLRLIALLEEKRTPQSPSSSSSPPTPRQDGTLTLLSALAVLATAGAPPWALAVWGAGQRDWGAASGLWVGSLATCLSLKGVSFARQCCFAPTGVIDHSGPGREGGQGQEKQEQGRGRGGVPLTCGEFLYFLLAAPSLVCEPRFLRATAGGRRQPRFLRAASEFSHAVLAFAALHAACSALFAPVLRVVATFLLSSSPSAASCYSSSSPSSSHPSYLSCEAGGDNGWVDCAGWIGEGGVFSAGGSGGWFFALLAAGDKGEPGRGGARGMGFFEAFFCGSGGGVAWWREGLAALAAGSLVFTPMVHFLAFYAFWHCVCMGLAELTGYPDRFLYGPWWLLSDEPATMFRLWSTPVHRWISSCVYRPTVDYYCGGSGGGEGEEKEKPSRRRRGRVVGLTVAFVFSSFAHEAVTYVAMRHTCWPFTTFTLLFAIVVIAAWDAVYPVISEIPEEAAGDRRGGDGDDELLVAPQPLPLERPAPASSSSSSGSRAGKDGGGCPVGVDASCPQAASGEVPPISSYSDGNGDDDENSFVVIGGETCLGGGGGGGGSGVNRGSKKKKAGSEWRGWGAVAFFMGSSLVAGLAVDFLSWQWWRNVLLR